MGSDFNLFMEEPRNNSASCVPKDPAPLQLSYSEPSQPDDCSESDESTYSEASTTVMPLTKIPPSGSSSFLSRSAEVGKPVKEPQSCMFCDEATEDLKIHLIATHNMTEEKAENLIATSA